MSSMSMAQQVSGQSKSSSACPKNRADVLDSVLFTIGILAVLRSKALKGKYIGGMITASHNPYMDNGLKLVEPMGEMLVSSWEKHATLLANSQNAAEIKANIETIIETEAIDMGSKANVVVGRDTRPSGDPLLWSFIDGVKAMNGNFVDIGIVTTPQLRKLALLLK